MRRLLQRVWLPALALLAFLVGCAGATDRYSPEIQRSFREHPMVRSETERIRIYHPAARQDDAQRLLDAFDQCITTIEALLPDGAVSERLVVVMPEAAFNNAYVQPGMGDRVHTVVPTLFSDGWLMEIGLFPSPGFVACHEAVHALQAIQITGFPAFMRTIVGPHLTPQIGLDFWFWEGLAVHHESSLQPGMGRMESSLWRQTWRSGVAHEGLRPGDMSLLQRRVPYGGHYLVGSHFVRWLAERHGEEKLWQLVALQGQQVLGLIGLNRRFRRIYGESLESLFATFRTEMLERWTPREPPPEEERILPLGAWPLLHINTRGDVAWLDVRPDAPPTLKVQRADGELVLRQVLPALIPGEGMRASLPEGLHLAESGDALLVQTTDLRQGRWRGRLLHIDVPTGNTRPVLDDRLLTEGTLDASGHTYWAPEVVGDATRLLQLDLATGEVTTVLEPPAGVHLAQPALSRDGAQLALLAHTANATEVWILSTETLAATRITRYVAPLGGVRHLVWEEAGTLLLSATVGDSMQVQRLDLTTSGVTTLTRAAWAAVRPFQTSDGLHYATLEGWRWHLARIQPDQVRAQDHAMPWEALESMPLEPAPPVSRQPLPSAEIHTTTPYRGTDRLFRPLLRAPVFLLQGSHLLLGARAEGRDVLDYHHWQVSAGGYGPAWRPFADASWTHRLWAPWRLTLAAGVRPEPLRVRQISEDPDDAEERWERGWRRVASTSLRLSLNAARASTSFEALAMQVDSPLGPLGNESVRLIGGSSTLSGRGSRASANYGTQSALAGSARVTALASDAEAWPWLVDPRLETWVVLPMVPSGRLTLRSRAVARMIYATERTHLIAVGEGDLIASLWQSHQPELPDVSGALQTGPYRWSEPLRGFEDASRQVNRLILGESALRFPVVLDRGSLTTLRFLPATMVREVRLETFGSLLVSDDETPSWATGFSVDLLVAVWIIPLQVRWQTSWRPSERAGPFHLVALVLEP